MSQLKNLRCAFYLFIRQPHGSEVSSAARNTLDSARIPRASKLLICGLFQKGRVLAQDGGNLSVTQVRTKSCSSSDSTWLKTSSGHRASLSPDSNGRLATSM